MKIKKLTLLLAATATVLYSCSKDDDPAPGEGGDAIKGTYDFVGMTVVSTSTATVTGQGFNNRTVTQSGYITKNNAGTVVVDGGFFKNNAFAYSIDTVVKAWSYVDGQLEDEIELPFQVDIPALSSQAGYKLVGTDSLYFEQGYISNPDGSGTGVASTPHGYKYTWSGDTLVLKTNIYSSESETDQGIVSTTVIQAAQTVKLKKK